MNIIGQRIIAYLRTDSTLTTLVGNANNIFAMFVQDRKDKYVVVSTDVGEDGNNIPSQKGSFKIECVVSRKLANSHKNCIDIAKRVDDLLNKKENVVSTTGWKIIHLARVPNDAGLQVDDEPNEFFYQLEYEYILDESS
jgi:galactokinase